MRISIIVAMDRQGVIGRAGRIPWRLPDDLRHFKKTTLGHTVIMGRKTHESIGRALPGRRNIVLTRQAGYEAKGCIVSASVEQALKLASRAPEVFVIGGSQIYAETIALADRLYLTPWHHSKYIVDDIIM